MRMHRIACGGVAGLVLLISAWLASASPLILVPLNATWRYQADGADQGTLWRQPSFNDFTWPSGAAELGYGDGDEATVIFTPTNAPRPITVYFRRNVVIPATITAASIGLVSDDGAVVYVNGVEVLRSNMPDGPVSFNTTALLAVEPTNVIATPISTAPFVVGTNVIAVEVHQVNSLSSDLSFALELIAEPGGPVTNNTPPNVAMFQPTNGATFTAPANIELRTTASDLEDGQPVQVEFLDGTNQIGVATFFPTLCPANCPYYSLTWSNAPVGVHTLRARATDSAGASTLSAPIQITVLSQPGGTNTFPIVRVTATDNSASEFNPLFSTGRFTFTRTGPISNSLPIFFALSGTASNGLDYTLGTNAVVIPPGSSNVHVLVIPIDDALVEFQETVVLTVLPPPPTAFTPFYFVGSPSNATVFIQDNDSDTNNPPEQTVVHIVATDPQAVEGTNGNPGQFAIRRSGNLGSAIPVLFTVSGIASNGGDYAFISNSVVIPAGATQALVDVFPVNDFVLEGMETVVLTLRTPVCAGIFPPPPECYVLGSPTQAVVNIADAQGGTNTPPLAFWLSPPNGSVFTQGMGILLQASAHDLNGSILRVEFRNNGALIGLNTSSAGTNFTFVWSNAPVGTHSLTAVAVDNQFARGTSSPVTITVVGPSQPPSSISLIPTSSVWKYLDNGSDQGVTWRAPFFDDSTWASGPSQLGFGDGDEATFINRDTNTGLSHITYYFRRVFAVTNLGSISNLVVRLLRDDGGVVYLNGVEVFRSNMPTGEVNYLTLAPTAACCEDETTHFYEAAIDPGLLVPGFNVVAVEIHQNNVASSDISFDLELVSGGSVPPPTERTVIHVVATDPQASEGGTNNNLGQFAIRRSGNIGFDVPVHYRMGGTASNGVDYAFVSNSLVLPAGSTQALVNIHPLIDNLIEGTETVTLTLLSSGCSILDPPPPSCYLIGSPTQAVVNITDAQGGGTNNPPVAFWLSPPNGSSITQALGVLLQASAHDSDGSIIRVEFRNNGVLIGLNTSSVGTNYSFFWSNAPVGTHTLTAVAVDNQLARGTSAPVTITVFGPPQPPPPTISLIPTGSIWKYLDDGSDQGIAWRSLGFEDSTWATGPGQLGFGDGDEVTVIRRDGTNVGLSHVTFYFRRVFAVTNVASISNLAVRLLRDDGGVVYLNGTEVFRSNMPTGEVNYLTLAPTAACCEDETSRYHEAFVDPSLLLPGLNVVAVEIHQNTVTSADLSFDLELIASAGNVPPPLPAVVSVVASDADASEPGATAAIYPGQFRFTRTGNLNTSLLVRFSLTGTASNITDYSFVSNHVTIPAGATQAVVNVVPFEDGIPEGTETVILTLLSPVCSLPDCYVVGTPSQATVFISDSQPGGTNSFPVVRVIATDSSASENNPMFSTGRFTFTRTGPISNSLPVFFALSGTAQNGFDYALTSNVVIIPPGSSNAHLLLTPIDDAEVEPTENVVLTVIPPPPGTFAPPYLIGSPSNATVLIQDNDGGTNNPPEQTVVHIVTTDAQAAEGTNFNPGQFTIRRSGNLGFAIPVLFTVSGTASNGADYNFVSNSVVIPAGATQAIVNIHPLNDLLVEGTETVVLTLRTPVCAAISPPPPECYVLGSPTQAVVNIADAQTGGINRLPIAQWLAPSNGSVFAQGMGILLGVSAHDFDGTISRVEFRRSGALIGISMSPAGTNYSFLWSNAPAGSHVLTAVAVDNLNGRGTSAPVTITVLGQPTNLAPVVIITRPTNGMSFDSPTSIVIEAVTIDLDGYADTVEFFAGDQKIGQSQVVFIQPPNPGESIGFEFVWTNPPPGMHVLRARTVDNRGAPGVSEPVQITVIGDGDSDDDGVPDDRDQCPGTVAGAVVNEHGCSIAQLCPCEGPWRNRFEYVQCVRNTSLSFMEAGLITPAQREAVVAAALASNCGRRNPRLIVPQQSSGDISAAGCRLLLEGDGPATCVIECSTDLGQWTPISTNTLSGTTVEIIDSGACNAPRRFYRMRLE